MKDGGQRYDGTVLASGSYDGLLRLWDVASGECLSTIFAEQAGLSAKHAPVSHACYSPSGAYVLCSTHDATLRLWQVDASPCRLARVFCGRASTRYCGPAAFHAACHRRAADIGRHAVVAGGEDGRIHVWDLQSAEPAHLFAAHAGPVLSVDPHPIQDLLASCAVRERSCKLWRYRVRAEFEGDELPPPPPQPERRGRPKRQG